MYSAQREAYFRVGRRARKWVARRAWFIFSIGLTNSYILTQRKKKRRRRSRRENFDSS